MWQLPWQLMAALVCKKVKLRCCGIKEYIIFIMKLLRTLLSFIMFFCITAGYAQKIIIVNGYFFNELPGAIKNTETPQEMQLFVVSTSNGTKAFCVYSPSFNLSKNSLQYTVPVEKIPEGEELLRRYNEQKDTGGVCFTMRKAESLLNVGDEFPVFTETDIDGKTWTNKDIDGKVMVLNLWFTGCGPCRREMPELSTWKDEMPDVMFFSSTFESPDIAHQVLDKVNFNWIPLVNSQTFHKWIGSNGYPLTIVVDKSGHIATFEYGTSPEQRDRLKKKISEMR